MPCSSAVRTHVMNSGPRLGGSNVERDAEARRVTGAPGVSLVALAAGPRPRSTAAAPLAPSTPRARAQRALRARAAAVALVNRPDPCLKARHRAALARKLRRLFASRPVVLAPMEDVTDAVFRRICRELGAELCVTEFVNVEGLLRGCKTARRKLAPADGDQPTAIQIYGANPERLAEAARVAEQAGPAFLDINCGCWVPKIAGRGAGRGLAPRSGGDGGDGPPRDGGSVALPVTVKTRIGWGPESHMPIVDLARRLEDAGVAALTIHCRTAADGAQRRGRLGAGPPGRARSCPSPSW